MGFFSDNLLEGKVALITGGGTGLGLATARAFGANGAKLVIASRSAEHVEDGAATLREEEIEALPLVCDVREPDQVEAMVDTAIEHFGRVDVLVNNAGVVHRATILETSEADWDRVMEVNVKAIYLLSREVIPLMVERGGGSIINMASGWGLAAGPRAAVYCASKGAVVQLTKGMAIDHAPDGVRVNCVCPGDVDTPMLEVEAKELGVPRARFLAEAAARPMERVGYASEIATSILYLAGSESAFVTGTSLVIDGGGLLG